MIGIIRQCRRCFLWRSVDSFAPLAKLCSDCIHQGTGRYRPVDRLVRARGYALTDKARTALKELAAA